jgi:hypothetical protein
VVRPGPPPSAGTAQTLILIGFIFQIIISVILIIGIGVVFLIASLAAAVFPPAAIGSIIFLAFGAIDIVLLYVAYEYSYKPAREGQYEAARGPTLLLGILGLIFGLVITGIFYIIGYVKLGDAVNELRQPMHVYPGQYPATPMAPGPMMTMQQPMAPVAPMPAAAPVAPAAPVCPRCGRPATWIPQYSRWYCGTDQQYL